MKLIACCVAGIFGIWLMFWFGFLVQPWAPWWISKPDTKTTTPVDGGIVIPVDLPLIGDTPAASDAPAAPVTSGRVSDVQRFQLCLAVGLDAATCIVMTAISIAEDGSGDPAIHSAPNRNKTIDLGLWQINSIHWADYGGELALEDPLNNARAMKGILGPSKNFCAWSTFETSCGAGYTGAYRAFIAGATQIAQGVAWQH